ncbi:MAG: TRAP transporter small permease subunit [Colwellia polaris]|jgi:TRAP-type mannitol/chloroaromatic compound transport system permease small subunit
MTDSFSNPTSSIARLMLKIADTFEAIILKASAICCWSSALLIVVIILNVTMRYGFNNGLILFEEIQWHLYAIGIMFGLSYAEITNSQVRVDVVASMLKPKTILKWEIFGAVFFIFPTIFVILFNSFDYVANSYMLGESSSSPLGMPFRWLIKAAIPASFILLAMAVLARMFRNIITINQKET